MKIRTLIIGLLLLSTAAHSQVPMQDRYPLQRYFDDSIHVVWTWRPNPFSPPTVRDTTKGKMCGGLTFYCDLSETVTVAFVNHLDSIVYEASLTSKSPPNFSLCYWIAGPHLRSELLPLRYFRSSFSEDLKLLLKVRGRWKSLREKGITSQKGWYYWINDHLAKGD